MIDHNLRKDFLTFYSSMNSENNESCFPQKNVKQNCFQHEISILEWFLKDHVTLKTWVMMLKIYSNTKMFYICFLFVIF